MARQKEPPLLWQTQFLQKVVVALMLLLSVATVGHLLAFTAEWRDVNKNFGGRTGMNRSVAFALINFGASLSARE
jgi:hypothetical protein